MLSVLSGATYAFANRFDAAYSIKHDLQVTMNYHIPLTVLTDSNSKSFFKIIVKSTVTTEKRPMIDIKATREAYDCNKITIIGWIRTNRHIADGLTKLERCDCLGELFDTGTITVDAEQWIVRNKGVLNRSERPQLRFSLPKNWSV